MFIALTFVAVTGILAFHFYDHYKDRALKWTAIAGVFGGAAVLAAAIGVPIALTQLFALERDLSRSNHLVERLKSFRLEGLALNKQLRAGNIPWGAADVNHWIDGVASFLVTDVKDEAEEETFRQEGQTTPGWQEIAAKLAWLRNDLLPKVRAGYW
jgi:hypothetical protein